MLSSNLDDILKVFLFGVQEGGIKCVGAWPPDIFPIGELLKARKSFKYVCFILNTLTSSYSRRGHWVGAYCTGDQLEYFDSLGVAPRWRHAYIQRILGLFETVKVVVDESHPLQSPETLACGPYCVYFILRRLQGRSSEQIVQGLMERGNPARDRCVMNEVKNWILDDPHKYYSIVQLLEGRSHAQIGRLLWEKGDSEEERTRYVDREMRSWVDARFPKEESSRRSYAAIVHSEQKASPPRRD